MMVIDLFKLINIQQQQGKDVLVSHCPGNSSWSR